jgi:hypothetical protein
VENEQEKRTLLNQRKARGATAANFTVGDYVLRSRENLLVTWVGPYKVVRADTHSFRLEYLITGEQADLRASRLKFNAVSSFEVTEEVREHVAVQGIVLEVRALVAFQLHVVLTVV